jgi:peptidoglycan hydrolase-like protein with peptidoglycan-binding domain
MNYGDKGDAVRQVQLALIADGYALPKYGWEGA